MIKKVSFIMLFSMILMGCISENEISPVTDNNHNVTEDIEDTPEIDLLLVMDNSCSMITDWDYLTYGLTQIPVELNQNNFDWQLALVSMDASDSTFLELDQNASDPGWEMISIVSSFREQAGQAEDGFKAALITKSLYGAWFRPNVITLIFFISDEKEQSDITPTDFHRLWGSSHIVASMVGPREAVEGELPCAEASPKWHDVSQIVIDICTTERWSLIDFILP